MTDLLKPSENIWDLQLRRANAQAELMNLQTELYQTDLYKKIKDKELEVKEFTATAGGGAVEVTVTGKKEMTKIVIDKDAVDPDETEMLQDMIMAAVNEAMRQAEEANAAIMNKMTGGLGGFPF